MEVLLRRETALLKDMVCSKGRGFRTSTFLTSMLLFLRTFPCPCIHVKRWTPKAKPRHARGIYHLSITFLPSIPPRPPLVSWRMRRECPRPLSPFHLHPYQKCLGLSVFSLFNASLDSTWSAHVPPASPPPESNRRGFGFVDSAVSFFCEVLDSGAKREVEPCGREGKSASAETLGCWF